MLHKSLWRTPEMYIYINNVKNQTPAVSPVFFQKGTEIWYSVGQNKLLADWFFFIDESLLKFSVVGFYRILKCDVKT